MKCVRVIIIFKSAPSELENLQKAARTLTIEGTLQRLEAKKVRITACGKPDYIDEFIDHVHQSCIEAEEIAIEPFIKDRDYRGVFRIIE